MTLKKIPYGVASYNDVRRDGNYYLDKTSYIPHLEEIGRYLFFIRPRRFGKSLLLSMLECYYDVDQVAEFETLFKEKYIYDHPTAEKNRYLVLTFNFSKVNPQLNLVEESFNQYITKTLDLFGEKYQVILGEKYFSFISGESHGAQKLQLALDYVGFMGHKVYVFIDEYDNFTNTILSAEGITAYHDITHGMGFYRFFFNCLKGAAGSGKSGVARLFITGVSPVTMDDVSSGFNIGQHITLEPEFNEMLGFTEGDLTEMLNYYGIAPTTVLPLMKEWYNNYRFSSEAEGYLFNTDMVLYFVNHYIKRHAFPRDMIDPNVQIDYGKLRHLMVLDKKLNGNFSYLTDIIKNQTTRFSQVVQSFPVQYLTEPENFMSLLFYFGLLSFTPDGNLAIPNETVKQMLYSYMRRGYQDVNIFKVNLWHLAELVQDMAYQGDWRPVFEFLAQEVDKQTSIRDYLLGEKVIQTFLLAYLNITDYYLIRTEHEMGKGFADLYLEPFSMKHERVKYSYLIELKYLTRSEFTTELLKEKVIEAEHQLRQYARDARLKGQLKCLTLVYAGWELKAMAEVTIV